MDEKRTTVVNIKDGPYDRYIGRGSLFGNPFRCPENGTRAEVVERYRQYFKKKLRWEKSFREAVEGLRGYRLGCYCKPLACHGDVIVEYLEKGKL